MLAMFHANPYAGRVFDRENQYRNEIEKLEGPSIFRRQRRHRLQGERGRVRQDQRHHAEIENPARPVARAAGFENDVEATAQSFQEAGSRLPAVIRPAGGPGGRMPRFRRHPPTRRQRRRRHRAPHPPLRHRARRPAPCRAVRRRPCRQAPRRRSSRDRPRCICR